MARSNASQRPSVTLVGAMSLDGKISTRTGDSRISSLKDLKILHKMRCSHDAVMIGVATLLKDNPRLTVRHVKGKNPIRIIVDSAARTPPNARILRTEPSGSIIAVTSRAPKERVRRLRQAGANVIYAGRSQVNLRTLLTRLHKLGIRSILLEGGGTLNWSMISDRLVDYIKLTVAPLIIGGSEATTLIDGEGVGRVDHAINLTPISITRQGREIVLVYKVK
ncbi:MAG: 2,5-diamino-6-(ribosylamino)-4(3H)-pyrimidinone 5'-phosphate reductase [Candidatus Bathyarchaeia archaeon]